MLALPEKVTLEGWGVRLEPLAPAHLPALAAAITDGALSELAVTLVPRIHELPQFLQHAEAQCAAGQELAFATRDLCTGVIAGSTRFMRIEARHRRAEIGFTFLARSWQRTHVNTAAKLLMLRHGFETWQLNRIELLTDVLNLRSRAAIARLGATQEGILRSHMIMRNGRMRDSVLFSLTASEWPAAKRRLEARLEPP